VVCSEILAIGLIINGSSTLFAPFEFVCIINVFVLYEFYEILRSWWPIAPPLHTAQ